MRFFKLQEGFSIVELLVTMLIVTFSIGAIMYGVTSIRITTDRLNTKEKAFDELANFTDFWKTKIAGGEWNGQNIWTPGNEFDLVSKRNTPIKAIMSRRGSVINGDYPYPLYSLETKIAWDDGSGNSPQELNLKVYQIEFK